MSMNLNYFKEFYLNNEYDENMFNEDGSINPKYESFKKTGLIATILEDHFKEAYHLNKQLIDSYRPNAHSEIDKIIKCNNKQLGCRAFECPKCNKILFVSNTCKSRSCSSCGYKYKEERVNQIVNTAYSCPHRQLVFTIPVELRKPFFKDFKNCINILFEAVSETIYSILNESYKRDPATKKYKCYKNKIKSIPGFFSFLHTFGRDLKWNPHIHVLLAENKLVNGKFISVRYLDYDALSKRFMKILLTKLVKYDRVKFLGIKNDLYKKYKNGLYVYAEKKKFNSFRNGIEYVTRYCGRVPISENRILNYDGENVTFCYNAHEDESYHEVTITAIEFILMLIRHIAPTQFKIIRYYGFYRKNYKISDTIKKIVDESQKKFRKWTLKHENLIKAHFDRNPYFCTACNTRFRLICAIT